ncbi:5'/3'-nucleotidase SurE [Anaerocolumna sp. AGMB13025]|uniref:5'/3'-nucleotidase SurE n=1 Tax=Anaerocolumna sp. AGMB13025 TaxID=3039116 RepID=UPI00241DBBD2|nr:5'/3'-nucleotidase SurE [Anaerocolumna sp. AGMB13025]WFR57392.1 5'/3'-nucleotidase SurE [Anaerocolumna sp. AGMB13025]
MKILITNDDGISAKGLITLAGLLNEIGEVTVVAPSGQRSAVSHGITVHEPLVVKEVEFPVNVKKAYSISGKPADCVRLAVEDLMSDKPDLLISGINAGPNFGQDVIYSGTVSGAIEGMFYNIPSLAFSLDGADDEICYHAAVDIVNHFIKTNKNPKVIWNVNFPSCTTDEFKGITYAPLSGHSQYPFRFHKYEVTDKEWYYFPVSEAVGVLEAGSDVDYVRKGYITVTPLTFNFEQGADREEGIFSIGTTEPTEK